jgi:hypothetical protein
VAQVAVVVVASTVEAEAVVITEVVVDTEEVVVDMVAAAVREVSISPLQSSFLNDHLIKRILTIFLGYQGGGGGYQGGQGGYGGGGGEFPLP